MAQRVRLYCRAEQCTGLPIMRGYAPRRPVGLTTETHVVVATITRATPFEPTARPVQNHYGPSVEPAPITRADSDMGSHAIGGRRPSTVVEGVDLAGRVGRRAAGRPGLLQR